MRLIGKPCLLEETGFFYQVVVHENDYLVRVTDFTVVTSCLDTYPHQYCDTSKSIVHVFISTEINRPNSQKDMSDSIRDKILFLLLRPL